MVTCDEKRDLRALGSHCTHGVVPAVAPVDGRVGSGFIIPRRCGVSDGRSVAHWRSEKPRGPASHPSSNRNVAIGARNSASCEPTRRNPVQTAAKTRPSAIIIQPPSPAPLAVAKSNPEKRPASPIRTGTKGRVGLKRTHRPAFRPREQAIRGEAQTPARAPQRPAGTNCRPSGRHRAACVASPKPANRRTRAHFCQDFVAGARHG